MLRRIISITFHLGFKSTKASAHNSTQSNKNAYRTSEAQATDVKITESSMHPLEKKFVRVKKDEMSDLPNLMDDLSLEESIASILPPTLAAPLPNEPQPIRVTNIPPEQDE